MIHHDGYNEKELSNDLENSKNVELRFDEIDKISFEIGRASCRERV